MSGMHKTKAIYDKQTKITDYLIANKGFLGVRVE
jgi:hypothetical protein